VVDAVFVELAGGLVGVEDLVEDGAVLVYVLV
jgi:hypothetical protein